MAKNHIYAALINHLKILSSDSGVLPNGSYATRNPPFQKQQCHRFPVLKNQVFQACH